MVKHYRPLNIPNYPYLYIYNQMHKNLSRLIKSLNTTRMASYLKQDVNSQTIYSPTSTLHMHAKKNKLKGWAIGQWGFKRHANKVANVKINKIVVTRQIINRASKDQVTLSSWRIQFFSHWLLVSKLLILRQPWNTITKFSRSPFHASLRLAIIPPLPNPHAK